MDEAVLTLQWGRVIHRLAADGSVEPQLRPYAEMIKPRMVENGILHVEVSSKHTSDQVMTGLNTQLLNLIKEEFHGVNSFEISINQDLRLPEKPQVHSESTDPNSSVSATTNRAYYQQDDSFQEEADHDVILQAGEEANFADDPGYPATNLNYKYTFENYVIGESNRFPHAFAIAIADKPGGQYNPLFIYGDSGLGKTHLLHAIGNQCFASNRNIKVLYVSTEAFVNDYVSSTGQNKMSEFTARYRSVDVLLVDDIQFLKGKSGTVEAFFNLFNALVGKTNKQIVITSDVAPKDLEGLEVRMTSRFTSGLMTDVKPPPLETRMAILKMKAKALETFVPEDVIEFMASRVSANIRELEGALNRVTAFASLSKTPINLELAETVLKGVISDEHSVISAAEVVSASSQYYELSIDELTGANRSQAIAFARQVAMYICRDLTGLSLPKIGSYFGNRDHTTVMYAVKKIEGLMKEKREVYDQVVELTSILKRARK